MSVSLASAEWDWHGNLTSFPAPAHVGELLLRAARFSPDGQILGINTGTKGVDILSYSS
ncbi:MAG: hypothetical protein QOI59_2669, partial [Gammaproteobacteria bacterium]|nr:hypothetical protein [Gammaproteobacteria bacterium]